MPTTVAAWRRGYPALFAGRDNGILVHGQTGGGEFKYAGGVYNGSENAPGADDTLP